jgi:dephospho-CoA kinase
LHPRIGAEARRQSKEANGPYQIIVIPLLVQSPLLEFIDRVLVVDCDVEVQIQRLRERDGETGDQARRILAAQATREERLSIADDVIVNNDTLASTRAAVSRLNDQYRRLAAEPGPP